MRSSFAKIVDAVTDESGISFENIIKKDRRRAYSIPRQLIMYIALEYGYQSTETALIMHRTHAAVLYGHRAVIEWQKQPLSYRREMELFNRVKQRLER